MSDDRMIHPYAVGERLYLRPLDIDDVTTMLPWLNDPQVTATTGVRWPIAQAQEERAVEDYYTDRRNMILAIALKGSNNHIGNVGLHLIDSINRQATFGLMIGDITEWGKGYGTEASRLMVDIAFQRLNLNRLELDVYATNPAARRIYEKLGFQLEGTRRQHVFRDGAYHDVYLMGLLRDERP